MEKCMFAVIYRKMNMYNYLGKCYVFVLKCYVSLCIRFEQSKSKH